jgi:putative transposase
VGPDNFQLEQWTGLLKQHLAKAIQSSKVSRPLWQRGFFDHLLRSEESYGQKWNYVRENPVRAGLAQNPEDWPYAGEIIVIDRL